MPVWAAITAAGAVGGLGAYFGGKAQARGIEKGIRGLGPYRRAGARMLPLLEREARDLRPSASYRIQRRIGEKSINRMLAARGLHGSGAGLQLLEDFNRRLLAGEMDRQMQERQFLAQLGAGAATTTAGAYAGLGEAEAGMYGGAAREVGGALSGYALLKAYQAPRGSQYSAASWRASAPGRGLKELR